MDVRVSLPMIGVFHSPNQMFHVETIEEQEIIYEKSVRKRIWNSILIQFISSPWILSLIGVPTSQQNLIYGLTFAEFIPNVICTILTKLPLKTNYFYHVYFYGRYSKECCPEYLKEENFSRLIEFQFIRQRLHNF